jgi:hypothetical protein
MKKRIPEWLEQIECFVDRAVPWMVLLLAVLLILEFSHIADAYHDEMLMADNIIVAFFVIDLCFKWYRTRNVTKFVKLHWIDIIAVFPFYAVFRLYAFAAEAVTATEEAQKILHETALIREAKLARELRVLRETEEAAKLARAGRFVRIFARGLRLLRARWYVAHAHMHTVSREHARVHRH